MHSCPGDFCDVVWNGFIFIEGEGDAKETQRVDYWSYLPLKQKGPTTKGSKSECCGCGL